MGVKFSAVVNCFNEEDFIKYSLESILPYVDEVIVVDNKSTDKTLAVIDEVIQYNLMGNKIKLFALKQPMQLAEARNFALSKSSNEWIIKWDGDFCAYSDADERTDFTAPFSEIIEYVNNNCNSFDIFLLYSLNICGDLYHFDRTRKFLGLSGDSFIGKRSCMTYRVNDRYGDVGDLRKSDGSKPILCYLNKPNVNKMYFMHIYGVKDDAYLLYRRFLSEYQVWLAHNEKIDFWDWMKKVKDYNTNNGLLHVKRQLVENLEKHNFPLPTVLQEVIDNPRYLVKYADGKISERVVLR